MSTPSVDEPRRPVETKQVNSSTVTPAPPSQPTLNAASTTSPQQNGDSTPPNAGTGLGMGAALAATDGPSPDAARGTRDRSNAIDRQLEDDSKRFRKECKILLLGESGSGDSVADAAHVS